jgi:hypothetical protein
MFETGIDGSSPTAPLFVDPEFRIVRKQELRRRPAPRLVSVRNISLGLTGLFALMGVAAATVTLFQSNTPSESGMASVALPSSSPLARDRVELLIPDNGASASLANTMPVSVPAPPPAAAPPAAVNDASIGVVRAPFHETAAIQPRRQQTAHRAPAVQHHTCSDCPPIDAGDLPPLGPAAAAN